MQFSNHAPVNGSTVSTFNPKIYVYVKDSTYDLVSSSLKVTINGTQVPASLKYTVGHWGYDTCGNPYWVVDSYKEAEITYQASNLPFGTQEVQVQIANSAGVTATETWSFTVAGDIAFRYMSPTTAVGIRRPVVSARAYAPNGSFGVEDVNMTVGGNTVTPTLAYQTDYYLISYQPAVDLPDGLYPVYLEVYNHGKNVYDSTNWSFSVSADMKASNHTPAKNSTVNVTNPKVSVYVSAGANTLNNTTVTAKLNGVAVTPTFQYKGHWEYDSCGNPYYVVDSYSEGTISFNTSALADGTYTVETSIANNRGEVLTETWSFDVNTAIKFSWPSPANGSVTGNAQPKISVRASDGTKDTSNIRMFINGESVVPTVTAINATTIEISHIPAVKMPDGLKNIQVDVFDTNEGIYKTTTWSFTVNAAPDPASWSPGKNTTVSTSTFTVALGVHDSYNEIDSTSVSAKINGSAVPARFVYATYSGTCGVYTDPTSGTAYVDVAALPDGPHTVEIKVSDMAGNTLTESWNFSVMEAPKFSRMTPANGSKNKGTSEISVAVTDTGSVDWTSVRMTINNNEVAHTVNEETGIVSYTGIFVTGNYDFYVEAKDAAGNLGVVRWSILVDNTTPYLRYLYYVLEGEPHYNKHKALNGYVITNGRLALQAELKDAHVSLSDNATARLIGTETGTGKAVDELLNITFRYHGTVDSCTGQYIVTDTSTAYITYNEVIRDGDYRMIFTAQDELGNTYTQEFYFTAATPPVINTLTPLKYGVQDAMPAISANVKDINGTVVPESIVMKVNGAVINHTYEAVYHQVSYVPEQALADESYHTIIVSAADDQGLVSTKSWKFYTNTKNYPDMADSNYTNCTPCHYISNPNNALESSMHGRLDFSGDHGADCEDCHNYVSVGAGCGQCHGGDGYDYAPHGSTPTISYLLTNYDTLFPVRVRKNREMFDCVICHQPGVPLMGYEGAWSSPTRYVGSHDIPDLHRANAENCSDCHALTLTREHARADRLDANGQPITCATCHRSSRDDVRLAISNNNTECGACHIASTTGDPHSDLHIVSYGTECVNCHGGNMMSEKVYHQNNCSGCHDSVNPTVQSAINLQNRTCFGCHETTHGVKMSVVREDIPLYTGLIWSKPEPATVWAGEGWLPDELNNDMALVLFSTAAQLSGTAVNDFYKAEMTNRGWTLLEETPAADGTFKLMYRKGRRHALVWFYSGMSPLSSSGVGYRIMVVYN
ncbi:MAG: hypothetical protein SCM57_04705 [Bacillota bacterium]|nr:hypothetical protein [Bacillota bacterium]